MNQDSGEIRTIVGPQRVVLNSNEEMVGGITSATIIYEDEYCIVKNPYDEEKKKIKHGDREIRVGPTIIYLHYSESIESIDKVHVLKKNQALRCKTIIQHDNKAAGEVFQVIGEARFIPDKYTQVLKKIDAILIQENEGIYVNNVETSQLKLVSGPCSYLLKSNEELFYKQYSEIERTALTIQNQDLYKAKVIYANKGEVFCVLDEKKIEKIISGPITYVLGAEEHVKCLWLSAGKPKKPKCIKVAKVRVGPEFTSDKFEIRTRDNANLNILITYKWEFIVDENEKNVIFSIPDFIGYSCTTLCSKIREETAKFTFEEFNKGTVGQIRKVLFKDYELKNKKFSGVYFEEIKLLISEIDVKEIVPVNPEISKLLNQSIKSNMVIVCSKMENEANLNSKKDKVKGEAELNKLKEKLITIQNENLQLEKIGKSKIDGQVTILKSQSIKECEELKVGGIQNLEIEKMKQIIELLNTKEGDKYLNLLKAKNFSEIEQKWIINSDSKISLPTN